MSLLSFERAVIFHLVCSSEDRWQTTLFLRRGWGLSVFYQNQSRTICQTPLDQTKKLIISLANSHAPSLGFKICYAHKHSKTAYKSILYNAFYLKSKIWAIIIAMPDLYLTVNELLVCLFIGLNSLIPFCLLFILICYVLCSLTPCVSLSTLTGISITRISSSC